MEASYLQGYCQNGYLLQKLKNKPHVGKLDNGKEQK